MKKNYSPTQRHGLKAEKLALHFLKKQGLKFKCANFRTLFGEIDLIMEDPQNLIFVEVRLRAATVFASPEESVDTYKQARIIRTAELYLVKHPTFKSCRFDVIGITPGKLTEEIRWIKNAFQVQ